MAIRKRGTLRYVPLASHMRRACVFRSVLVFVDDAVAVSQNKAMGLGGRYGQAESAGSDNQAVAWNGPDGGRTKIGKLLGSQGKDHDVLSNILVGQDTDRGEFAAEHHGIGVP